MRCYPSNPSVPAPQVFFDGLTAPALTSGSTDGILAMYSAEVAKQADAPRSGRGGYYIREGSNPSLGTKRAPVEIIQLGFLFVRRPEANQVTIGVR